MGEQPGASGQDLTLNLPSLDANTTSRAILCDTRRMAGRDKTPSAGALIAGLDEWLPGPVTPEEWVGMMGNFDLAVGYSFLFWPSFVRFDDFVLRQGFREDALRGFERSTGGDRPAIESVMNHVHIVDIHCNEPVPSEIQIRHIGRVLKAVHEVKLKADFPELSFVVLFNDEPGLDPLDYQLTFLQARN